MNITEAKRKRMRALSTQDGIIAALAMDQRKSLRRMIAGAGSVELESITDQQLSEFKTAVSSVLSTHTSAILLDPEYGLDATRAKAQSCGLIMTYEMDGYENPRPHRMLALMPHLSVRRLRDLGADGIKILLSYAPRGNEAANDEKRALVERIGSECAALDMPFFLEPVVYDPNGGDPTGIEFARKKPSLVLETMEEFSKDVYNVDVLKVEFPVNVRFVEGCSSFQGSRAHSTDEAVWFFSQADTISSRPYIYLSAGIGIHEFVDSLQLAAASGARYSGVLCGRANWQDGVPLYAKGGLSAFQDWLASDGVRNIQAINDCLRSATSWEQRLL